MQAPHPIPPRTRDAAIEHELIRISGRAWGVAVGLVSGLAILIATNLLILKGGDAVGTHLGRLSVVLPGYDVSVLGSVIGFVYFFVAGYGLGRVLSPRRSVPRSEFERRTSARHPQLSSHAWGSAFACLLGLTLFAVTNALLLLGGDEVGPLLSRLNTYLPGYSVTFVGSLVGLLWLAVIGYALGRTIAALYNRMVQAHS